MKIIMVCRECGEPAKVDNTKSTKNFTAYETECHKCDGQVVPKVQS